MADSFFDDPAELAPPRAVRLQLRRRRLRAALARAAEALRALHRRMARALGAATPDAVFLAERDAPGGWRTAAATRRCARRSARSRRACSTCTCRPGRPVVVLSDNSVDHALLMLAAMHVGRPVCTVSSAYCRLTKDYTKIHGILNTLGPALVYASDAAVYGPAIASAALGAGDGVQPGRRHAPRRAELRQPAAHRREPGGDGGLRGHPARRPRQVPADLGLDRPPEGRDQHAPHAVRQPADDRAGVAASSSARSRCVLDWLPWSHTFGGNHNFNLVLRNGGTLYIDEGRPAPGLVEKTVTQPARGAADAVLQRAARLRHAAALPRAGRRAGARLLRAAAHGSSTPARRCRSRAGSGSRRWRAACATSRSGSPPPGARPRPRRRSPRAHWTLDRAGCIGAPLPGVELKFVPNGAQARDARARRHGLPRLPQRAGADRAGLRRGGLLPDRRRRPARRPRASPSAASSSTAGWPRTSSSRRAPGCRSARCACASFRRWRRWCRTS